MVATEAQEGIQVSLQTLIDQRLVARELVTTVKRLRSHQPSGGHVSSLRGRGMEFDQVRVYSPGDDVRSMDWRVTARSGEPHIKLYHEERERPVFVMLDCTQSMFFGTRVAFKSVVAAKVAAIMGWATVLGGDRIGAVLFNEQRINVIKPRARDAGILPVLQAMVEMTWEPVAKPATPVSMSEALTQLRHVAPTGSLVLLLSDFEQMDAQARRHCQFLAQHQQLIAGYIYDPLEQALPNLGACGFSDGAAKMMINSADDHIQTQYAEQFDLKIDEVSQFMLRLGQSFFQLACNQPILPVLRDVLLQCGGIHR